MPMDIELCADGIVSFIRDSTKRESVIAYLQKHDYGNEKEIEKIIKLAKL